MNTPDWSKAPIDATRYGTDTPNWGEGWYKLENGEWFVYWDGSDGTEKGWCEAAASLKSWPERESSLIPRPTQWRGQQDGLPPVGALCCYQSGVELLDVQVVAIVTCGSGDPECIVQGKDDWWPASLSELRSAKSDRDRAIEEIAKVLIKHESENGRYATVPTANAIYDAGYRKQ